MGRRITAQDRAVSMMISDAHRRGRCATGSTVAIRKAMSRRVKSGRLHRVHPNMYADRTYWAGLTPAERTLHIIRTLADAHPDWVFAGLSAALVHGLDYQWELHDRSVTILTSKHGGIQGDALVKRLFVSQCEFVIVDGIKVTNLARTVADCGFLLDFHDALSIADAAFARGLTAKDVLSECAGINRDHERVLLLARYANPRSENGGESFARGVMLEEGFAEPELQVEFVDPLTGKRYRVDFVWRCADGRVIVGEFDGRAKYMDPEMTKGHDPMHVFQDEREREDALKRAGVTTVFRLTHRDVANRIPLVDRMIAAGVPRTGVRLV